MVRVGIVGLNYGTTVLVPAFRKVEGFEVVAICGTNLNKATDRAVELNIPNSFSNWRKMLNHIDAVAIAVPPGVQPAIALEALQMGKAVFANKPLAADLLTAEALLKASYGKPTMMDFGFPELPSWIRARELLTSGAIGNLRNVQVTWNVETYAVQQRLDTWKNRGYLGGGALGNLGSHVLYYLEWFCGPIASVRADLQTLPDDSGEFTDGPVRDRFIEVRFDGKARAASKTETGVVAAFQFESGASGSMTINTGAYLGSGHRVELYGEEGTVVLENNAKDYMRGFWLRHGSRSESGLFNPGFFGVLGDTKEDGRITTAASLIVGFKQAIEEKTYSLPNFASGYRVQYLLDACRRSAETGQPIKTLGVK